MQLLTGITKIGRKRNLEKLHEVTRQNDKWFFNNEPKEKNIDWKETALIFSKENIQLRKQLKYWMQVCSDQKKNK